MNWVNQLKAWIVYRATKWIHPSNHRQDMEWYLARAYIHERLSIKLYRQYASQTADKSRRDTFYRLAFSHEQRAAQPGILLISLGLSTEQIRETWPDIIWYWILAHIRIDYALRWIRWTERNDLNHLMYFLAERHLKGAGLQSLPNAHLEDVNRLVMVLAGTNGQMPLAALAKETGQAIDRLPLTLRAVELLEFATLTPDQATLTELGKNTARLAFVERKQMIRQQALRCIPLLKVVENILRESASDGLEGSAVRQVLRHHWNGSEADRQFAIVMEWGRYIRLFEYDSTADRLHWMDGTGIATAR